MSEQRSKIEIGYRVGMLTVTERTEQRKNGYTIWLCKCDCGGEIRLDTRCRSAARSRTAVVFQ